MHRLFTISISIACAALVACKNRHASPTVPVGSASQSVPGRGLPQSQSQSQLDRVRPPAQPCQPGAPADVLVTRAGAEFEEERYEKALACAEEALELDPRDVPALHYRAASMAALGRLDNARVAFERALAVDPDDPETLWSAADFFLAKLNGDREVVEVGLEYALRGARFALRPPRRDSDLAARLDLLAGMAENDLGRSQDALKHLDETLALHPDDSDALYERGVALYELCRFKEAERTLAKMMKKSPDDAWAIHYMGLLAERAGDEQRAQSLLRRAAELSPADFKPEVPIDRSTFQKEVNQAVASLPAPERAALKEVPVQVDELPALTDLTAVDPPL